MDWGGDCTGLRAGQNSSKDSVKIYKVRESEVQFANKVLGNKYVQYLSGYEKRCSQKFISRFDMMMTTHTNENH